MQGDVSDVGGELFSDRTTLHPPKSVIQREHGGHGVPDGGLLAPLQGTLVTGPGAAGGGPSSVTGGQSRDSFAVPAV